MAAIVGWPETQPCMWLLGSVSPLEEGIGQSWVTTDFVFKGPHTVFYGHPQQSVHQLS